MEEFQFPFMQLGRLLFNPVPNNISGELPAVVNISLISYYQQI
jgi:hypothetical protein